MSLKPMSIIVHDNGGQPFSFVFFGDPGNLPDWRGRGFRIDELQQVPSDYPDYPKPVDVDGPMKASNTDEAGLTGDAGEIYEE